MGKTDWSIRTVGVCFLISLGVAPLLIVLPAEPKAAASAQAKPSDAHNLSQPDGLGDPLDAD